MRRSDSSPTSRPPGTAGERDGGAEWRRERRLRLAARPLARAELPEARGRQPTARALLVRLPVPVLELAQGHVARTIGPRRRTDHSRRADPQ